MYSQIIIGATCSPLDLEGWRDTVRKPAMLPHVYIDRAGNVTQLKGLDEPSPSFVKGGQSRRALCVMLEGGGRLDFLPERHHWQYPETEAYVTPYIYCPQSSYRQETGCGDWEMFSDRMMRSLENQLVELSRLCEPRARYDNRFTVPTKAASDGKPGIWLRHSFSTPRFQYHDPHPQKELIDAVKAADARMRFE